MVLAKKKKNKKNEKLIAASINHPRAYYTHLPPSYTHIRALQSLIVLARVARDEERRFYQRRQSQFTRVFNYSHARVLRYARSQLAPMIDGPGALRRSSPSSSVQGKTTLRRGFLACGAVDSSVMGQGRICGRGEQERDRGVMYMEKNLLVNFTIFIKKFIIFLVMLGHTQNLGFLLF